MAKKGATTSNEGLGQLPVQCVVGSLRARLSFWQDRISDKWALDVVERGYSIEFVTPFPPLGNKILWTEVGKEDYQEDSKVLLEEIIELLHKDAIEKVDPGTKGFYSSFFIVPKKGGGKRPILNLRPLNRFVKTRKFRMETNASILQTIAQGDWLASLDLRDAYFHVQINPKHRPYLRFAFQGVVYQFNVLPFGLSSAPRVFTKVLAPVVGLIHQEGINFHPYLDDCLLVAPSAQVLSHNVDLAVSLLQRAGFLVNWKKSHPLPSQSIQFLGMRIEAGTGMVHLPDERASDLAQCANLFYAPSYRPARLFLRLLGLMASSLLVVPLARLMMRPIQMYFLSQWKASTHGLNHPILVPLSLIPHLQFWKSKANLTEGVLIHPDLPTVTVTTDACNKGWGGHSDGLKVQGRWSNAQKKYHINCLEMLAVHYTLRAFSHLLLGKVVCVETDNIAVRQYLNKQGGTGSPALCALAMKLLTWCKGQRITLVAEYIAGIDNTLADTLSRKTLSQTEWSLKQSVAQALFELWEEPLLDLFATAKNTKTLVFCSWRFEEKAHHIDALSMSWRGLQAYAFPPLALLQRVLLKASQEQVRSLILIAPNWPSRTWFPLIIQHLIEDPIRLPLHPDLLTQQRGRLLHANPGDLCLVAWLISGEPSLPRAYQNRLRERLLHPGLSQPIKHTSVVGAITLDGVKERVLIPLLQL